MSLAMLLIGIVGLLISASISHASATSYNSPNSMPGANPQRTFTSTAKGLGAAPTVFTCVNLTVCIPTGMGTMIADQMAAVSLWRPTEVPSIPIAIVDFSEKKVTHVALGETPTSSAAYVAPVYDAVHQHIVAAYPGGVLAYHLATQQQVWNASFPDRNANLFMSPLLLPNGDIIAVDQFGLVARWQPPQSIVHQDGEKHENVHGATVWRFVMTAGTDTVKINTNPVLSVDGTIVYVAAWFVNEIATRVYAYRVSDGSEVWFSDNLSGNIATHMSLYTPSSTSSMDNSPHVIGQGETILYVSLLDQFVGLHTSNGLSLFRSTVVPSTSGAGFVLAPQNMVVVQDHQALGVAYNASGTVLWTLKLPTECYMNPVGTGDGKVMIGCMGGELMQVDAATGKVEWKTSVSEVQPATGVKGWWPMYASMAGDGRLAMYMSSAYVLWEMACIASV